VALPQEKVVDGTLNDEDARLKVDTRLNQIERDESLLTLQVLLLEEFSETLQRPLVELA
jgi:hypothetical protein